MKKTIEGYFSLEAALVLPMVLWVILFIVYLLFFQYNRCLMEQDMGILALRGALIQAENNTHRVEELKKTAEEMDYKKYIAWETEGCHISSGQGKVSVQQRGQIMVPFRWNNEEQAWWSTTVSYENKLISPVTFIRTCRRLKADDEPVETEEGRE